MNKIFEFKQILNNTLNQQTVLVASLTATRARKHDINTLNLSERIKKSKEELFLI